MTLLVILSTAIFPTDSARAGRGHWNQAILIELRSDGQRLGDTRPPITTVHLDGLADSFLERLTGLKALNGGA